MDQESYFGWQRRETEEEDEDAQKQYTYTDGSDSFDPWNTSYKETKASETKEKNKKEEVVIMPEQKVSVKKRIVIASNKLRVGKDGKNEFAHYDYFRPDDIMKNLNPILEELNIITIFNLKIKENYYEAILTIEDTDTEDKVIYEFDINKASVKGANEAQNSGATLTYAKRYLLMNVFNIADNEADFDAKPPNTNSQTQNVQDKPNQPNQPVSNLSEKQIARLWAIAKAAKQDDKTVHQYIQMKYKKDSVQMLTKVEYDEVCKALEAKK